MSSGRIMLIAGSSQTGKTSGLEAEMLRTRRALVWDYQGQFAELPGFVRVRDAAHLHQIATTHSGPGKFSYVARGELARQFDGFCRAAHFWGEYLGACHVVAEELSTVTNPSKAPSGWGDLVRMTAKYGLHITAITQRPAESDKTVLGNAHVIRCYRMTRAQDREYMAAEMGMTADQRARFVALPNYEYAELDTRTGRLRFGKNPVPKHIKSR